MADGGVDVATAEEKAVDVVGGVLAHGGSVETVVGEKGGVGGERREKGIQVGLKCCVGLVKGSVAAEVGAVNGCC